MRIDYSVLHIYKHNIYINANLARIIATNQNNKCACYLIHKPNGFSLWIRYKFNVLSLSMVVLNSRDGQWKLQLHLKHVQTAQPWNNAHSKKQANY